MKKVEFRLYQPPAIAFLKEHPRCNLYAGMGLGKTLICTSFIAKYGLDLTDKTLIIAPKRVAGGVWPNEVLEWEHLAGIDVSPVLGTVEERRAALRRDVPIYSINYDNLPWLVNELDGKWPFANVIADESTRLKGYRTTQGGVRTRALAPIAFKKVKRWINLSGTPAPNGLRDLWGQQWFIDGGAALGRSFSAFENRWFYKAPNSQGYAQTLPHVFAQAQIEAAMRPTTLSIDAKDYFDIADPIVTEIYVDLPPQARQIYQKMSKDFFAEVEGRRINAATSAIKSQKLLQLANGAIYQEDSTWSWVHDAKIDALESIFEEASGAPILVAYQFKTDLARLQKAFPFATLIKGKVTEDRWNAKQIPMGLIHPASGGHGLNLQHGGNIIVYFGQDWNLEENLQVLERIGPVRQMQAGYDRPVFVYHIMARNTMDNAVKLRRENKLTVMDSLIASQKMDLA